MKNIFEYHYYAHPFNQSKDKNTFKRIFILKDYYTILNNIRIRTKEDLDFALNIFKYLPKKYVKSLERKLSSIIEEKLGTDYMEKELNCAMYTDLDLKSLSTISKAIIVSAKKLLNREEDFTNDNIYINSNKLKNLFNLTELETDYLIRSYLFKTDEYYGDFLSQFSIGAKTVQQGLFKKTSLSAEFKAFLMGCSPKEFRDITQKNSTLIKTNLIDDKQQINQSIIDYFLYSEDEPFSSIHYYKDEEKGLDLKDFSYIKDDIDLLKSLFSKKSNSRGLKLLLYGKSGTGKTSFAKSLISAINREHYILKSNNIDKEDSDDRRQDIIGLYCFEKEPQLLNKVIVIDEAEELLSTRINRLTNRSKDMKKSINLFLDESKSNQIWIVNEIDDIDESTRRRFNYSIRFNDLTYKERVKIWKKQLHLNNISTVPGNIIEKLSKKYPVAPGIINKCVDNFCRLPEGETKTNIDSFISISNKTVMSHLKMNNNERIINNEETGKNFYSSSGISTKQNVNEIIESIERFNDLQGDPTVPIHNMNIIFYGVPGTGKTEFVKHIATKVDKRILSRSAKDILGQYVGQTEKNIAKVFKEAEEDNLILHIDEIDSLLFNRNSTSRNWEVSQINEFLQSMEEFKGILICTTNRLEHIDPAALRRFTMKIEFDYLKSEGILMFFNLYFKETNLTDEKKIKLLSLKKLTPGDFKTVYNLYMFNKNEPDADKIITMLEDEVNVKSKGKDIKLGFI